jgi:hypothetical protein
MEKIIVNIDKEPFFKTSSHRGFIYSVIGKDHPCFNNWILSELTSLYYDNKNQLGIYTPDYKEIQLLDIIEADDKINSSESIFHECIRENLKKGYSAVVEISGLHETAKQKILVYGYIYEKETYLGISFDKTGNVLHQDIDRTHLYNKSPIYFLKRNETNEFPIDWWKLSNDLKTYYYGIRKNFIYKNGVMVLNGLDAMNRVINILDNVKNCNQEIDCVW